MAVSHVQCSYSFRNFILVETLQHYYHFYNLPGHVLAAPESACSRPVLLTVLRCQLRFAWLLAYCQDVRAVRGGASWARGGISRARGSFGNFLHLTVIHEPCNIREALRP